MVDTFDFIVNKYKINLDGRYIIDIPNMGRDNLAGNFAELDFKKGAEIGVFKGKYSEVLCKANPQAHIWGVMRNRHILPNAMKKQKKECLLIKITQFLRNIQWML